jgi:hypothetical protein
VLDLARLAPIDHEGGQPLGQFELGSRLFSNTAPPSELVSGISARTTTLESERDLRYTGCSHRVSFSVCLETSRHRFYSTSQGLGGSSLSSFMIFSRLLPAGDKLWGSYSVPDHVILED